MVFHLFIPIITPMIGGALAVLFNRQRVVARAIALISVLINLGYGLWLMSVVPATGPLVAQGSGWLAPFGISLVADGMSALMVMLAALLMLTTIIYSFYSIDEQREHHFYYPLLLLLLLESAAPFSLVISSTCMSGLKCCWWRRLA